MFVTNYPCGHKIKSATKVSPACPECIKLKMTVPNGLTLKHSTGSPIQEGNSIIASGINPGSMFKYMTEEKHPNISGALLLRADNHETYNLVTYRPFGSNPGFKMSSGALIPTDYAMLVDIEGKTDTGPHWVFPDTLEINQKTQNGIWSWTPKCITCKNNQVYFSGLQTCLSCQQLDQRFS